MNAYKKIVVGTGDGSCELELLPEFGGVTNRLRLKSASGEQVDVIAGLTSREALRRNESFRGVPMFPFANRLENGSYQYGNKLYSFDINEPDKHNCLHGFLQEIEPEVTELTENEIDASVSLLYRYNGNKKGYPFPVDIHIKYSISRDKGLSVEFTVMNKYDDKIPVGLGWHPYFQLDKQVDTLCMKLPKVNVVEIDERMLPTGRVEPFEEFERLSVIADRQFDHCFQIEQEYGENERQAFTTLYSTDLGIGIEVWQDGCEYIQVYIPSDRKSIAIEPVSCGINAFNTGAGLMNLLAGESCSIEYGVRII